MKMLGGQRASSKAVVVAQQLGAGRTQAVEQAHEADAAMETAG